MDEDTARDLHAKNEGLAVASDFCPESLSYEFGCFRRVGSHCAAILYVAAKSPSGTPERANGFLNSHAGNTADSDIFGWLGDLANDEVMGAFSTAVHQFRRDRNADCQLIVFDSLTLCIGENR